MSLCGYRFFVRWSFDSENSTLTVRWNEASFFEFIVPSLSQRIGPEYKIESTYTTGKEENWPHQCLCVLITLTHRVTSTSFWPVNKQLSLNTWQSVEEFVWTLNETGENCFCQWTLRKWVTEICKNNNHLCETKYRRKLPSQKINHCWPALRGKEEWIFLTTFKDFHVLELWKPFWVMYLHLT